MEFAEKSFWVVILAFVAGVLYGIGYQLFLTDISSTSLLQSYAILPVSIALTAVCAASVYYKKDDQFNNLWFALLIWLYFPFAIATALLATSIGCNENVMTIQQIRSPSTLAVAILIQSAACWITVKFLRARTADPTASIVPYLGWSIAMQFVLGPIFIWVRHLTL